MFNLFRKILACFKPPEKKKISPFLSLADCPSTPRYQIVWMGREKGREVVVQSLPVGRYLEIIPKLDHIPALLLQNAQYRANPVVIMTAAADVVKEEFLQILEIASGLDRNFLVDECSLPELVRFLKALYEVNELEYVSGEIERALKGVIERARASLVVQTTDDQSTG